MIVAAKRAKVWEDNVQPKSDVPHGGLAMLPAAENPSEPQEPPSAPPAAPAPSHEEDPMLRFSEVAAMLGVSWQTVQRYVNGSMLKAEWRGSGLVVRRSVVQAFMGKNYTPPTAR